MTLVRSTWKFFLFFKQRKHTHAHLDNFSFLEQTTYGEVSGTTSALVTYHVLIVQQLSSNGRIVRPRDEIFGVSSRGERNEARTAIFIDHYLVTRKAGSAMMSGPIRMCPCSTNFTAAGRCCAMRLRAITTGSRRRQNRLAVILSTSSRFSLVGIRPIACLESERWSNRMHVSIVLTVCRAACAWLRYETDPWDRAL